ncbi:MAG: hypothetical protein LBU28_06110 [Spirochaetaceae bacterium]|jgi:hypothetical protein|nr:hypothetical protein [Spirochaetaceae bacterium]
MGSSVDWRDIKYQEIFEQEIRALQRRRASDPGCTAETLEGVLQHLYIMDGADWGGRGEVQDITLAATIAAYEAVIARWRSGGGVAQGLLPGAGP